MKTRNLAGLILFLWSISSLYADDTFDFVIQTSTANETFAFYLENGKEINIEWGDGSEEYYATTKKTVLSHVFVDPGTYTNKLQGETATRIAFGESNCTPHLLYDITSNLSDGITGINSGYRMFRDATNITAFSCETWFDDASRNVTTLQNMFEKAYNFNQDLNGWDVGQVTSMYETFRNAWAFNGNISNWSVTNLTTMYYAFFVAKAFNQDLSNWNVGKLTNMLRTFKEAESFTSDLGNWAVSNVTTTWETFYNAKNFNADISQWDVSRVTKMTGMFGYTSFNQPIGCWNVSNVQDMASMFQNNKVFNQPIGNWGVGSVTNMQEIFYGASAFDQPIGNWDVSQVENMYRMFHSASAFNQDLSKWNVGKANTMRYMFYNASLFTSDLSKWDVSAVTLFQYAFYGAKDFDSDLSRWNIDNATTCEHMLSSTALSTDNYNKLLIRWSRRPNLPHNIRFDTTAYYDRGLPEARRQYLIDHFGWDIRNDRRSTKYYWPPGTVIILK